MLVCALSLLMIPTLAVSSVETKSGSFAIEFQNAAGKSQYTLIYAYPAEVSIGQNLTITTTLEVNDLTGVKLYVSNYQVSALVHSPGEQVVARTVSSNSGRILYPGGHFGPINITIPLRASDFGLASGQTTEANLSIGFVVQVWYDFPVENFFTDTGSRDVGTVRIVNQASSSPGSGSYVVASAVLVAIVAAALLGTRRRHR